MIFNARQGFCMRNLNIIHHSKQSLYFINSTPLSITNNLHCPSIKRATSISYLYRSPPVHNTACTKISFWTSSYRIAQYMGLTLHYFSWIRFDRKSEVEFKSFTSFKTVIVFCQFNSLRQNWLVSIIIRTKMVSHKRGVF